MPRQPPPALFFGGKEERGRNKTAPQPTSDHLQPTPGHRLLLLPLAIARRFGFGLEALACFKIELISPGTPHHTLLVVSIKWAHPICGHESFSADSLHWNQFTWQSSQFQSLSAHNTTRLKLLDVPVSVPSGFTISIHLASHPAFLSCHHP